MRKHSNTRRSVERGAPAFFIPLLFMGCSGPAGQQEFAASGDSAAASLPVALWQDATAELLPPTAEWTNNVELADVDNAFDLDVLVSCKRCAGSLLFRNDGTGVFEEDPRALPQYTNNYEFEAMDLDGDGSLDLVTANDGNIVGERYRAGASTSSVTTARGASATRPTPGGPTPRTSARTTTSSPSSVCG